MRGAHCLSRNCRIFCGIIPADAGSTSGKASCRFPSKDHPRGCGEHGVWRPHRLHGIRSSPRMRGARVGHVPEPPVLRIIPADAGSTGLICRPNSLAEDHPRGCGEHDSLDFNRVYIVGSSPRMRGALARCWCFGLSRWIIPADAGSTSKMWCMGSARRDHPRGCGEHALKKSASASGLGSSPRMRGAPGRHLHRRGPVRIIPADAGSTDPLANIYAGLKDHPRGCGEHFEFA